MKQEEIIKIVKKLNDYLLGINVMAGSYMKLPPTLAVTSVWNQTSISLIITLESFDQIEIVLYNHDAKLTPVPHDEANAGRDLEGFLLKRLDMIQKELHMVLLCQTIE